MCAHAVLGGAIQSDIGHAFSCGRQLCFACGCAVPLLDHLDAVGINLIAQHELDRSLVDTDESEPHALPKRGPESGVRKHGCYRRGWDCRTGTEGGRKGGGMTHGEGGEASRTERSYGRGSASRGEWRRRGGRDARFIRRPPVPGHATHLLLPEQPTVCWYVGGGCSWKCEGAITGAPALRTPPCHF